MAAEPSRRLGFNRSAHIKQGRDFARIRREGERLANGCLIANLRRKAPGEGSRLGVITSSKLGGAVVRSRARRLLREAFRLHQHELSRPLDLVLVARASIVGLSRSAVEKDFLTALRRARALKPPEM